MVQVPSTVSLCGIDIESRLFPTGNEQVVARGNVEFTTMSITNLPLGWSDSFKLVHQRLLVAALQLHEWKQAISEMYRVITPGGWLQLGEVGSWQAGPVTVEHIALLLALFKSRGLVLDVYKHIPKMMREAGFIDVYEEERPLPLGMSAGQYGINVRDNFMGVFRGMKIPTLKAGGFGFVSTEEEYDALMASLEQEWDETSGAHFKFFIICGRKPF
ncbi:hypothetical protein EIP86_001879 [Pleurotus ostreatoroseus]|nr:hypothetical protein EIP86_001879 [Pleurotus ostreatoroseus]